MGYLRMSQGSPGYIMFHMTSLFCTLETSRLAIPGMSSPSITFKFKSNIHAAYRNFPKAKGVAKKGNKKRQEKKGQLMAVIGTVGQDRNKIIRQDWLMQPRSRSHQDNRYQRSFHTHKNTHPHPSLRQEPFLYRTPLPYPPLQSNPSPLPFQHSLPMAESLQFIQMVKNKTAIDELQALASSKQDEGRNWNFPIQRQPQQINAESLLYEDEKQGIHGVLGRSQSMDEASQTGQYYKAEMTALKQQLHQQLARNTENTLRMRRLERCNQELEYEIGILLRKLHVSQNQNAQLQRIRELEQQLKQQLIINLELEELLLRRKMKDQANNHPAAEHKETAVVKELKLELAELKNKHKREVDAYANAISQKNDEIAGLKESLKLAEIKQEYYPFTFHKIQSPKVASISPPPLLDAHSDKNPPHFTSTNPSLQGAEARKKTDSFSSKDNKCLCLDNISLRSNAYRTGCKTDRR